MEQTKREGSPVVWATVIVVVVAIVAVILGAWSNARREDERFKKRQAEQDERSRETEAWEKQGWPKQGYIVEPTDPPKNWDDVWGKWNKMRADTDTKK